MLRWLHKLLKWLVVSTIHQLRSWDCSSSSDISTGGTWLAWLSSFVIKKLGDSTWFKIFISCCFSKPQNWCNSRLNPILCEWCMGESKRKPWKPYVHPTHGQVMRASFEATQVMLAAGRNDLETSMVPDPLKVTLGYLRVHCLICPPWRLKKGWVIKVINSVE